MIEDNQPTTVRVGLLSAAHVHTNGFASLLNDREDTEFVGVADSDAERGRAAAERHGVPYLDTEELLMQVDAAVILSTNTTHGKWVRAAADIGVDILCEKPLATDLPEARDLVAACDDSGINLGMMMPLPFSEPARRAKRAYEGGALGELRAAVGTNRAKLRNRHETGWSANLKHAGGGAVMDHTVHIVGLVRWITNQEVVSVHAELATMNNGPETEDINVLSMGLDDGTPFTLDGSWDRPENWDYWGDATLNLVGTEGELSIDCFDYKLTETRDADEGAGIHSVYYGERPNDGLLDDFLSAVREDRPPLIDGQDGLREAAVCIAAYESAEQGGPVNITF